ncbi:MAG: GNAT family N-acetyltransferase [Chloroflexota bacterium]|nr:GNAT family N-acetyltransferase [Chloroflexota bacterium]
MNELPPEGASGNGPASGSRYALSGHGVRLRPAEPADIELVHSWYEDADTARLAGERPRSLAARQRRFESDPAGQGTGHYAFIIVRLEDEQPVGGINLFEIDHVNGSASFGITVATQERGKGHGRDAIEILLRFGFEELRLERIWLDTDSENTVAQGLYASIGFVHEARLRHHYFQEGGFIDAIRMAMLRSEWQERSPQRP